MHPVKLFTKALLFFPLLILFGCSHQMGMGGTPAAHQQGIGVPSGIYLVEGQYIWDSWVVDVDGVLYRYALSAPQEIIDSDGSKRKISPDMRHDHAYIRLAQSHNRGQSWVDRGPVIVPRKPGIWPDHVIWTSSVQLRRNAEGKREFLMFITGRSKADGELQRIGLTRSNDGLNFSPPEILLNPSTNLGYDITDDDGIIMAWRDPFVFQDPQSGIWHMFFSAKARDDCGNIRPTVGHAISQSDSLTQWLLQPPLTLPQYYHQLEVPYVLHRDGKYYLLVSTQNNPLMPNNEAKEAAYRGYVSGSINGPWELLYDATDRIYGHKIYAPTVFESPPGTGNYSAVSFFSKDTRYPYVATPLIPIRWDPTGPQFMFDKALACCLLSQ